MSMALNDKHKLGFVDGSIVQPSPNDPSARTWSRCNSMVISWEIGDNLLYLDTAQAAWNDIYKRFQHNNTPWIF